MIQVESVLFEKWDLGLPIFGTHHPLADIFFRIDPPSTKHRTIVWLSIHVHSLVSLFFFLNQVKK